MRLTLFKSVKSKATAIRQALSPTQGILNSCMHCRPSAVRLARSLMTLCSTRLPITSLTWQHVTPSWPQDSNPPTSHPSWRQASFGSHSQTSQAHLHLHTCVSKSGGVPLVNLKAGLRLELLHTWLLELKQAPLYISMIVGGAARFYVCLSHCVLEQNED